MSNDGVKKSKLNIQGMLCNGMRTPLGEKYKKTGNGSGFKAACVLSQRMDSV